jgi:chemotaxis protein histidine kinase CheA
MACESGDYRTDYTNPPAVTSTALRPTVEAAQVAAYQSGIQAQHTVDAVNAMQTATAIAERQTATAEAVRERRTATAEAAHQTATAVAIRATASVEAAHATATQNAADANATATAWQTTVEAQQAAATATARAEFAQATATTQAVQATSTAHTAASNATATAEMGYWQIHATATKAAANAIATAQTAQSRQAELAAKREELIYPLKAYGPWALLIVAVILLVYGALRMLKVFEDRKRVVETGTGQILIVDGRQIALPTRQWGPVLDLDERPALTADHHEQDATTRRDQLTSAIRASHPPAGAGGARKSPTRQHQEAHQLLNAPRALPPQRGFRGAPGLRRVVVMRKLDHAIQGDIVPPNLVRAIEQDWEQQVIEGEYREL